MAAYNRAELEELTKNELTNIAREEFDLPIKPQDNKDRIIEGILAVSEGQARGPTRAFTGFPDENGTFEVPPKHVVMEIQGPQWDMNKRPVFVSVNGKGHYIPVETPVCVHEKYLNVLKDARRTVAKPIKNANVLKGEKDMEWQTVYSYPFQVHYHNKTNEIVEHQI